METKEGIKLDTLPKLLRYKFEQHPNKEALREKDRGIWRSYTWKDYYYNVRYFSLGLVSLGFKRGDKICILGENKPQWYYAELGAQAAGGAAVGIYPDCVPREVKFYVEHSDSVFVVAHDQEQVDKVLEIKDELPLLKKIIYWDPKGLWSYRDPILASFDEVCETGKKYDESNPSFFDQMVDHGSSSDISVICYTSGTTGEPKGVLLDQKWLLGGSKAWAELDDWKGNYLSFLSPAWATDQGIGIAGSLIADITVNFPEKAETVNNDLREIGPNLLFYGARLWEVVNRNIQVKIADSTIARRIIYKMCLPIGLKVASRRSGGKKVNLFWRILYFLAYHAIFRQLRDNMGFSNLKVAYSGGAALSPDIINFFLAIGIEIRLSYGCTETWTISTPQKGDIKPETSGAIVPWAEVKISDEGEILCKSNYIFRGYYKNPKATEKKFRDGWYQTGDFGYVIDKSGYLIVIDRMEDLKSLASGKKFSPQYLEIRLRFSPYIKDMVIIGGEERDYVVALAEIDIENVGKYAEKNRISYTTFTELSQKAQVINLVRKEIAKVNQTVPDYSRIKKFVNLFKELDPDEAELTRTRKLRRGFIEGRYRDLIEALYYSNGNVIKVESPISYRDGRTGIIRTTVMINDVEEERK